MLLKALCKVVFHGIPIDGRHIQHTSVQPEAFNNVFPWTTVTTLHYNGRNSQPKTNVFVLFSKKSPHEFNFLSSRTESAIKPELTEIYAYHSKHYSTRT